jgi:O-antigen ligase
MDDHPCLLRGAGSAVRGRDHVRLDPPVGESGREARDEVGPTVSLRGVGAEAESDWTNGVLQRRAPFFVRRKRPKWGGIVSRIAGSLEAITTAANAQSMPLRRMLSEGAPPVLLAVVVSGFWLYLGALELVGIEPRTSLTAGYYSLLAVGLVLSAWAGRETIQRRMSIVSRLPRAWAVAAIALATWFLVNVALLSSGVAARDAAALLVLSSLPSALLVLSLTQRQLRILAGALVALSLGLLLISLATLVAEPTESGRFSPIDELNPITVAHIAALGAIVLLAATFEERRARLAQAGGVALLVALSVMPASRGAFVALVVAIVTVALALRSRILPLLLPAVLVGFVLGGAGASVVGSDYYWSIGIPELEGRVAPPSEGEHFTGERVAVLQGPPSSSLEIRRYLWSKALRDSIDRPILGHGVGMLVDDSPETLRLVRAGRADAGARTYPHNVLIESVYSLGILGLGLFLAASILSVVALARILRRGVTRFETLLVLGFAAFAAVNEMVSGEIGSDASLWIAMALPVALYADGA